MAESGQVVTVDDSDPVVFEAPVYLSKLLLDKLHIFQHPVRPKSTNLENPVLRSRIKPNLQEVELEVKIDTKSANYDRNKGVDIARRVDGAFEDGDQCGSRTYESGIVDRVVLRSGPNNPDTPVSYAVAKYQNGELHLCPIEAILQLQPAHAHGDIVLSNDQEKIPEDKDESVEESSPQKVSVKFSRHESERTKKMKMMTYSYYMKKRAEEKWIDTQHFSASTDESELERWKVLCCRPELDIAGLNVRKNEYLKNLVPYTPAEGVSIPDTSVMVSVASLKSMYWQEKLRSLLLSAKLIQFSKIVSLLSEEKRPKDVNNLLRALQTQAVMVRGNWVVKSEVMYPEKTKSRYNGVPATIMCRARDYMLSLFQQQQYVGQVKFVNFVRIPREEAKEMLTEVACYHENKGWDLLNPTDKEFMQRYPEVTVRQQMMWEDKKKALEVIFKEMHEPSKTVDVPKRQRKKSGRETSSSGNESGADSATPRRRKKPSSATGSS